MYIKQEKYNLLGPKYIPKKFGGFCTFFTFFYILVLGCWPNFGQVFLKFLTSKIKGQYQNLWVRILCLTEIANIAKFFMLTTSFCNLKTGKRFTKTQQKGHFSERILPPEFFQKDKRYFPRPKLGR